MVSKYERDALIYFQDFSPLTINIKIKDVNCEQIQYLLFNQQRKVENENPDSNFTHELS